MLDNDYARQFPTDTPLENLRVTAAHEYFHAVQFAYDAFEDAWFMEATATWAEDELYTDINDNLQYLRTDRSAGRASRWTSSSRRQHHYGAWIFFRYLTEQFPAGRSCRTSSGRCGRGPTARPAALTCTRCRPSALPSPPTEVVAYGGSPGSPTSTGGPASEYADGDLYPRPLRSAAAGPSDRRDPAG